MQPFLSLGRLPNSSFLMRGMAGRGQGDSVEVPHWPWGPDHRLPGLLPGVFVTHAPPRVMPSVEGAGLENPSDPVFALLLLRCEP